MILSLRIFAMVVLASMLAVTGWASTRCALWQIPFSVGGHPWFVATLFDTYFAFVTFWLWVCYKEVRWISRISWLIAILLLGNIAMAIYLLVQTFRVPLDAKAGSILLRATAK